ncbi:hypothetical protein KKG31_02815 [Patescibacteria group bacterium]|nr:hypothetical protein [Patescibacteria group bacterium]MBU1758093.1 hypothetical protein [Patescibacteria group bacterium]
MRIKAIQILIEQKFDRFATMPFAPGSDTMHITGAMTYPNYPNYFMTTGIGLEDDLDLLLKKKIQELSLGNPLMYHLPDFSASSLNLSEEEIAQLQKVYLFKNEQDLKDL